MAPARLTSALNHLRPSAVRQQPLLHDSVSVVALGLSLLFNVVTFVLLILKVHQVSYPVPTHYLSLVGFDQTGAWYSSYRLAGFALAVTLINILLAAQSFKRNRVVSFLLLVGAVAVSVLCCVISLAFAAIT
jgi:hypothetical protein